MACGCVGSCSCVIVGDGETASVVRVGDTFTVSAIPVITDVIDTDCVQLAISTPDKLLSATLVLADAEAADTSVQLECTPDGLTGDVRIDPASTAPISLTTEGLRLDLPAPAPSSETAYPGTIKMVGHLQDEAGWLEADGSEVSRLTYPDLLDALSLMGTTATRVMGTAQITGMDSTKWIGPGMEVEANGFPSGLTVVSIDGPSSITVSANATSNGADTTVRVYPWGAGDGGGTFNLPIIDDEFVKGPSSTAEPMGSTGGANSVTLNVTQIPAHEHPGSTAIDAGHDHTGGTSSDGAHAHIPATAGRNFVTVDTATATTKHVAAGAHTDEPPEGGDDPRIIVGEGANPEGQTQLNNTSTSSDGAHSHTFTTSTDAAAITLDIAPEGGGLSHENRPAFRVVRHLVKT